MNKIKILALTAAACLTVSSMSLMVRGDEETYDPANDPLISLSYLSGVFAPTYDKKITDLTAKLAEADKKDVEQTEKIAALEKKSAELEEKLAALEAKSTVLETKVVEILAENDARQPETYEVICLVSGETLLATSPLEIILRSGSAVTVSAIANGVNDLTGGTELMNEDAVPLYHQLLVPRGNDGRGITVTSEEAYIMVRGSYEIVS